MQVDIANLDYIWRPGNGNRSNPDLMAFYAEFEEMLAEGRLQDKPVRRRPQSNKTRDELWHWVRDVYLNMRETAGPGRPLIEGMKNPLKIVQHPDGTYMPMKGNQRLCCLRAAGHVGLVPCVFLHRSNRT